MRQTAIPLPSLSEQREIVQRVKRILGFASSIETKTRNMLEDIRHTQAAILASAFSGTLVPTEAELARQEGRGYEPASVLLERTKAERQEAKNKPRRKTKFLRARPKARA